MVNLQEYLQINDSLVYILDSHRPMNLHNLFGGNHIVIIDEEPIEHYNELKEAYETIQVPFCLQSTRLMMKARKVKARKTKASRKKMKMKRKTRIGMRKVSTLKRNVKVLVIQITQRNELRGNTSS